MKKRNTRVAALILAAALIFSGCSSELLELLDEARSKLELSRENAFSQEIRTESGDLHFPEMEYVRPDMDRLQTVLDAACETARGTDLDAVIDGIFAYYDEFDWFYTYYCIADIRYSQDLTNAYWEEEYYFCVENSAKVDAGLEELYYALAKSPCREALEGEEYFGPGYFDAYDGENNWDEAFTQLLQREAELQNRYYDLSGAAVELEQGSESYYQRFGDDMAQVLVDLISVRQEMAEYWGYDSYADFAWDFYYYRDYSPDQMVLYLESVRRELVPLYRELALTDVWDYAYRRSSESQIVDYVRRTAQNMGGSIWDAFQVMEGRELYDVAYSENKYDTSFEVYLTCYEVPFVFVAPSLENYDKLVFVHEFGHFCNDYLSFGSSAGVDVLEVFSQGMEYLSLCYSGDDGNLARVKLADSLSTYVEQSAFAAFEHRIYELEHPTVEDLYSLYDEVAQDFGFESVGYDKREFITISHFYTNPMYIDSYVVSNDAAMQLYQLELEGGGEGLARFEKHLDTQELWFLSFLEEAELASPFESGRLESVRDLFRRELLP